MITHGHTVGGKSREYRSWQSMHERCTNPNHPHYEDWGGRGITVCERWDKFENFLADMGSRPPDTTLDRIDNDGDYEPQNCRWATWPEQLANRRHNYPDQCTEPGCHKPYKARGLCNTHYMKALRHGTLQTSYRSHNTACEQVARHRAGFATV